MNIFDKIYIGVLNAQANADAKAYLRRVRAAETAKNNNKESDKETPKDKSAVKTDKNNKKENPIKKETLKADEKATPKKEEAKEEKTTPTDTSKKVEGSEKEDANIIVDNSSTSAASNNSAYVENKYYDMSSFMKKSPNTANTCLQNQTSNDSEKYFKDISAMKLTKITALNQNRENAKEFILANINIIENAFNVVSSANEDQLKQIENGIYGVSSSVNEESKKFANYINSCLNDIDMPVDTLSNNYNFALDNDVAVAAKKEMREAYNASLMEVNNVICNGNNLVAQVTKAIADRRVVMNSAGYGYVQQDHAESLQKKPKPEKPKPEKVNLDIPKGINDGIDIKKEPEKINAGKLDERIEIKETPQDESTDKVELPKHPTFDNSHIFNDNNGYLKDICDLAEKNGIGIKMDLNIGADGKPNGLITCNCFTNNAGPNIPKCFTIDTGNIMDRRPKMYMETIESLNATNDTFEDKQAYHITRFDEKEKKKVINEKLFNYFFQSGKLIQTDDKVDKNFGMYKPDEIELNKHVALITFNKKGIDKELNKEFRTRMLNALKVGLFTEYPNTRFELSEFDPKKKTFTLTSKDVPINYGSPVVSPESIKIDFGENGNTTVTKL